ncbi:hypothetical protein Tco_0660670 [Tanacetum coccineum]
MVSDLEDPKPMLLVGYGLESGALIHKNHEGSKHEGQRIRLTIGDFGGTCASNQSSFNNGRIEEWGEKEFDMLSRYVTIGKSYKVVLCIVDDIDECHILLGRPWRCEVNGKYDVKRNLYLFSWEGRRIAMVPPKVTPQLPKPEVKVEEKIVKAEVVDEHIEKIQDLQNYKQHDDKISTLLFETTNKVGTLKTCEEIMGFNDDEDVKGFICELKMDFECVHNLNIRDLDYGLILRMSMKNQIQFSRNGRRVKKYEGFRVDVKRKSVEDKVSHEVFDVDEALDIENSRASSF